MPSFLGQKNETINSPLADDSQPVSYLIDRIGILLTTRATGGLIENGQEVEYINCRERLLNSKNISCNEELSFIFSCRTLGEFWCYIQPKFKTYAERRVFIRNELNSIRSRINCRVSPLNTSASLTLDKLNSASIRSIWLKSVDRLKDDPDGAITAAKTFLEDVFKNILNDLSVDYRDNKDDLPKLFSLVSNALNLAPAQHLDKSFKEILSANFSIVFGIATLRNKLGDAHASGKRPVKPNKRHAEWVVNLASSLAIFLVDTWEYNKTISSK